jgi:hypothetical protein
MDNLTNFYQQAYRQISAMRGEVSLSSIHVQFPHITKDAAKSIMDRLIEDGMAQHIAGEKYLIGEVLAEAS